MAPRATTTGSDPVHDTRGTAARLDELRRPAAWPRPWSATAPDATAPDTDAPDTDAPGAEPRAELVQTHISWVLLGGDRVYKLKQPLDLGFLDYSTLERRRHFCEREVQLNRRLARDTYLGVRPVVVGPDGLARFGAAEDGDPDDGSLIDWAVEMVRLPADRMLERLLERGEVDNRLMDRLAALLADFHRKAATGPGVDEHGGPDALRRRLDLDFDDLADFVGLGPEATLSPTLEGFLRRALDGALATHADLLAARVAQGRVREGHGDLHAGNICCVDEVPLVYDCIEFDPGLRCGDVAADIGFLAMDLDRRGYRGFSRYLVRRYAALTDDRELPGLMPLFKAQRALVRGKVASIRAADASLDDATRRRERAAARHAFQVAACGLMPPVMVLTCGLPASGKSWLARRLAAPTGALVLRSDVVRKQLAGLAPERSAAAPWGQGLYTPEAIDRTYQVLLDEALAGLDQGRSVIVDATFADAAHRRRFLDAAARLDHPVALVHLDCPEALARQRLAARAADPGEASDADAKVYDRARETFQTPDEVHPALRVDAGPDTPPEVVAGAVIDRCLNRRAPDPGRGPHAPEEP